MGYMPCVMRHLVIHRVALAMPHTSYTFNRLDFGGFHPVTGADCPVTRAGSGRRSRVRGRYC